MKELTLREMQLAELDILIAFDKICRENGINYTLDGGTLLGAIRHKGFIPWDDDVDISMARPDYEKFYKLVTENKDVLPDNLEFIPDRGENARIPFCKIVDKNFSIVSEIGECCDNLWIDIFPFDGYPKDDKKALAYWKKVRKYRRIVLYNYANCSKKKGLKKIALKLFSVYARAYGAARAIGKIEKLVKKYPYEGAECIGPVRWSLYGIKTRLPADSFESFVSVEFEGKEFMAIEKWETYLKGMYGDYMQLPPEDKRHTHGIKAFKITE